MQFIDSKSCNLCNQGLVDEMQTRIAKGKNESEAARELATEINDFAGEIIYTPEAILNRFRYYAKGRGTKKDDKPERTPIEPSAIQLAGRAIKALQKIPKTDPQWKTALYEVGNWINDQFK